MTAAEKIKIMRCCENCADSYVVYKGNGYKCIGCKNKNEAACIIGNYSQWRLRNEVSRNN